MGRILVFTYSHHPCGWTTWCWECEPWPTGKETQMPFSQCQWKPSNVSITFSNLCGYFWVIGEHYPFTSSVTPLKQGITLHKALAIFFHFPCDTLWIPTKHHEKKQTKRQGVLESNMPAPAGILFFITYMAWVLTPSWSCDLTCKHPWVGVLRWSESSHHLVCYEGEGTAVNAFHPELGSPASVQETAVPSPIQNGQQFAEHRFDLITCAPETQNFFCWCCTLVTPYTIVYTWPRGHPLSWNNFFSFVKFYEISSKNLTNSSMHTYFILDKTMVNHNRLYLRATYLNTHPHLRRDFQQNISCCSLLQSLVACILWVVHSYMRRWLEACIWVT